LATKIEQDNGFTGYYIQEVNYILGSKFRLCFQISKKKGEKTNNFQKEWFKPPKERKTDYKSGQVTLYTFQEDGYHGNGAFCFESSFEEEEYKIKINQFVNMKIISDGLWLLTLEYVTYEASQNVHSYSFIEFSFPSNGVIMSNVGVFTMKLNQYQSYQDMLRLALELLYCLLLIGNIGIFLRKMF